MQNAAGTMKGKHVAGAYDSIGTESTMDSTAVVLTQAGSDSLMRSVSPLEGAKGKGVFGANITLDGSLSRSL